MILAVCLRGGARFVLEGIAEIDLVSFTELKAKLELRFEKEHSVQSYYFQFINRRQKFGQDFVTLSTDLERLARLIYPECSFEVIRLLVRSLFLR